MNRCECPIDHSMGHPKPFLGCLSNHAALAARMYLMQQLQAHAIDMTLEQFKVMVALWHESPLSQQDIANFVGKDKTSITRLLDGLQKRQLVIRQHDPHDKRSNHIFLTPQGEALKEPTMHIVQEATIQLHRHFDPEELDITLRVLTQMCHILTQETHS